MTARILAIDDHPVNLKLVRVLLAGDGFEVYTAGNAEEARAIVAQFPPDLILMDLQLPGMDGFQLTRLLKSDPATRDICIVAMTAYAMKGDSERAREAGCDGYLSKPLDTRALPGQIRGYLDGRTGPPTP